MPARYTTERIEGGVVRKRTLNGVVLEILTLTTAKKLFLRKEELRHVGGGWYAYTVNLNREKIFKAAGYDVNKIDLAVPPDWLSFPENRERYRKGDQAAWYYGGKDRYFGEAIWDSDAWKKIRARLKPRGR
jgi:hypothetical protein